MYSPWLPACCDGVLHDLFLQCIPHRRSRFRAHRASPKERARDKRGWVDVVRVMWSAKRLGTTFSDFDWLLILNTNIDTMISSRTNIRSFLFVFWNDRSMRKRACDWRSVAHQNPTKTNSIFAQSLESIYMVTTEKSDVEPATFEAHTKLDPRRIRKSYNWMRGTFAGKPFCMKMSLFSSWKHEFHVYLPKKINSWKTMICTTETVEFPFD